MEFRKHRKCNILTCELHPTKYLPILPTRIKRGSGKSVQILYTFCFVQFIKIFKITSLLHFVDHDRRSGRPAARCFVRRFSNAAAHCLSCYTSREIQHSGSDSYNELCMAQNTRTDNEYNARYRTTDILRYLTR